MKIFYSFCLLSLVALSVNAQNNVGIGTPAPDPTAILDLTSSSTGVLIPRLSAAQRMAIVNPANALMVFDTDSNCFFFFVTSTGLWDNLCGSSAATPQLLYWQITGNSGTAPSSSAIGTAVNNNFIGTTDNNAFVVATDDFEALRVTGTAAAGAYNTATDGFVGIGTSAPLDKLHVASINTGISIQDLTPGTGKTWRVSSDSQGRYRVTDATDTQPRFEINPTGTGTAALADNTSTLLAANTPVANLQIDAGNGNNANIKLTNSTSTGFTATDGFDVGITAAGSAFLKQYENLPLVVYTNNTERERILASGDISVNLAAPNANIVFSAYGSGYPAAIGAPGDTAIAGFSNLSGVGVYGENNNGSGVGVLGSVNSPDAVGVQGQNVSNLTTTAEIAFGVYGTSTGTVIPGSFSLGVYGFTPNSPSIGVVGAGNGQAQVNQLGSGGAFTCDMDAIIALATDVAGGIGGIELGNGLTNFLTPTTGCGVLGMGSVYGVMGIATNVVNTDGTTNYTTNGTLAAAGGYFEVDQPAGNTYNSVSWAYVGVQDATGVLRKIIGNGTVNTIVKDTKNNLVALSCPEAPENLFQDLGKGQLQNGKVHITLDPTFSKNIIVNEQHDLRVFVQLKENCNGVFVTNQDQNGFDVVELGNGTSNAAFTWMVYANRADEVLGNGTISKYSAERFAAAPGPQDRTFGQTVPLPAVHAAKTQ